MSETLLMIFEIIGTVAFSVSGAMVGIAKKMDIFGIVILGLTTAVGGGVIRDVVLGITPPITFVNPVYAAIAVVTAIVVFLPSVRRIITKSPAYYEKVLLLMDSIGLGVFTAVGIRTAYGASYELADANNIFLLIFVGLVTGVGGGVLRDIMAGDRSHISPSILRQRFADRSCDMQLDVGIFWTDDINDGGNGCRDNAQIVRRPLQMESA
ncbi:MAG: trimeric intracellular cation channel family protein [Anaerovoracaceae bacterium]